MFPLQKIVLVYTSGPMSDCPVAIYPLHYFPPCPVHVSLLRLNSDGASKPPGEGAVTQIILYRNVQFSAAKKQWWWLSVSVSHDMLTLRIIQCEHFAIVHLT